MKTTHELCLKVEKRNQVGAERQEDNNIQSDDSPFFLDLISLCLYTNMKRNETRAAFSVRCGYVSDCDDSPLHISSKLTIPLIIETRGRVGF